MTHLVTWEPHRLTVTIEVCSFQVPFELRKQKFSFETRNFFDCRNTQTGCCVSVCAGGILLMKAWVFCNLLGGSLACQTVRTHALETLSLNALAIEAGSLGPTFWGINNEFLSISFRIKQTWLSYLLIAAPGRWLNSFMHSTGVH